MRGSARVLRRCSLAALHRVIHDQNEFDFGQHDGMGRRSTKLGAGCLFDRRSQSHEEGVVRVSPERLIPQDVSERTIVNSPGGRVPLRIRIGVTGHRWEGDAPGTVAEDVAAAIHRILALCAHSPSSSALTPTVVSALAEGADRLVARQVLAHPRSRLEAVLPFAPDVYCEDFTSEASRREFTDFLARASTTTIVPCGDSRDLTYRSAGVEVVMRSDVIVAVWDGTSGDTGGTAEIVCVAAARGLPLIWVNSRAGGLIEEFGGVERPLTTDDVVPLDRVAFELLERYNNEAVRKHPDARLVDRKSLVADGEISPLFDDDRVHDVLDWVEPYFERAENVARDPAVDTTGWKRCCTHARPSP